MCVCVCVCVCVHARDVFKSHTAQECIDGLLLDPLPVGRESSGAPVAQVRFTVLVATARNLVLAVPPLPNADSSIPSVTHVSVSVSVCVLCVCVCVCVCVYVCMCVYVYVCVVCEEPTISRRTASHRKMCCAFRSPTDRPSPNRSQLQALV